MIKRRLLFSGLLIAAFCLSALAADVNGTWTASIETQVGVQNYTFTFKVDGEKLTVRRSPSWLRRKRKSPKVA